MHVLQVAVKITSFIPALRMVPHRVLTILVMRKIRMPPVDQRKIESDLQPLFPHSIDILPNQVTMAGRVGRLEIRILRVIEAEAIMVLCRHDHIFHPGIFRCFCPLSHIQITWVKGVKVLPVLVIGHLLIAHDPLTPCRNAVKSVVDEHPESGFGEPFHPFLISCAVKLIHLRSPSGIFLTGCFQVSRSLLCS